MGGALKSAGGWGLPAAVLGSSIIGGLTAPEGQELSSFEGREDGVGPTGAADEIWKHLQSYLTMALTEAQQPVGVRTTVHPLPSFSGGGLPFDIAAPAVDPNRLDASLRTLEPSGYQTLIPELFGGQDWPVRDDRPPRDPRPSGDDDDPPVSKPRGVDEGHTEEGGSAASGYNLSQFGAGEDVSDVDQAQGAIDLLLEQLNQSGGRSGPTRRMLA